jgi:hypothetical protein
MRRQITAAALVVSALLPSVLSAQTPLPPPPPMPGPGQARDAATQKTGTARLSGRVTSLDSGRPIRRAVVRATGAELREGKSVSTDVEGRWELREIPAGRFTITVTKGGYVTLSYGQQRPFEAGKTVEVRDGVVVEKLDVALPRGGAVTGRVVDEFGEPVVGANVSPMRHRYVNGQRQLTSFASSDTTDDLGQYRLHGLPPGDYYIAARPNVFTSLFGSSDDRTGYGQTFHPGASSASEASRVTVTVGQEVQNVVISLSPSRVANISGTLTASNGKPVRQGMVMVRAAGAEFAMGTIRPGMVMDGKWSVSGVTPGEYDLVAQAIDLDAIAQSGGAGMRMPESVTERITVTGEDLSSVALVTSAGGRAEGVVKFEGGEPPAVPSGMSAVMAFDLVPESMTMGGTGMIKPDWTFELTGLTGRRLIRVNGIAPGWTLKSVTVDGTDVTDTGLEVKPGDSISGLEVLLTRETTELSGVVQSTKGTPVTDYVAVIFASEPSRWGYQSRYVRVARPDQTGRFVISGLPPGSYLAAALDYAEPGQETDPEFLDGLKQQASAIRLTDGEKKMVTLKLSPR